MVGGRHGGWTPHLTYSLLHREQPDQVSKPQFPIPRLTPPTSSHKQLKNFMNFMNFMNLLIFNFQFNFQFPTCQVPACPSHSLFLFSSLFAREKLTNVDYMFVGSAIEIQAQARLRDPPNEKTPTHPPTHPPAQPIHKAKERERAREGEGGRDGEMGRKERGKKRKGKKKTGGSIRLLIQPARQPSILSKLSLSKTIRHAVITSHPCALS